MKTLPYGLCQNLTFQNMRMTGSMRCVVVKRPFPVVSSRNISIIFKSTLELYCQFQSWHFETTAVVFMFFKLKKDIYFDRYFGEKNPKPSTYCIYLNLVRQIMEK